MRTKKLFSMKKVMRTMALGLAAMLVVGSVNVMEVEAEEVFSPYYNQTSGKYVYNPDDVFGGIFLCRRVGSFIVRNGTCPVNQWTEHEVQFR